VVVHSDITRATPNNRILPVLLAELETCGVERSDITLLNGLGTHRKQTELELRLLLGDFVVDNYLCVQHDCNDDENLVSLGETSLGHPVRLNRLYVEADFRILTGFIEPHFFAGFSGGPKGVLPSIAGAESVQTNHSFRMIADPHADWGITDGNPIWEEMCEVALRLQPVFLLNVALNRDHQISAVFAGDLNAAFKQGCEFVSRSAMIPLDSPFDIVLTTNGGYPLDQNLYQALKGISAAGRAVLPGGAIVMFSACEDGLPDHGLYAQLLRQADSPQRMLQMLSTPGFSASDQWQVQIQAQILLDHPVFIYSDGLTDAQVLAAHYLPCRDVAATLAHLKGKYGSQARICVMPEGPQTVPYPT
jgi:nickel-dependent lactate racemase